MMIKYVNTKADYEKLVNLILFDREKYKKQKHRALVTAPILMFFLFMPLVLIISKSNVTAYFILFFIFYYVFTLIDTPKKRKKITSRYIDSIDNESLSSEKVIEIDEKKIVIRSNIEKTEIMNSQISVISLYENLIVIGSKTKQLYLIPKDAIIEGSFNAFFLKAKNIFIKTNIDSENIHKQIRYNITEDRNFKKQKNQAVRRVKSNKVLLAWKVIIAVIIAFIAVIMVIKFEVWSFKYSLILVYQISLILYLFFDGYVEDILIQSKDTVYEDSYLNEKGFINISEKFVSKSMWNNCKDYIALKNGIVVRTIDDYLWLPNSSLENSSIDEVKEKLDFLLKK